MQDPTENTTEAGKPVDAPQVDAPEPETSRAAEDSHADNTPRPAPHPGTLAAPEPEDYLTLVHRMERRRIMALRIAAGVAAVVLPIIYLVASGKFSTAVLGSKPTPIAPVKGTATKDKADKGKKYGVGEFGSMPSPTPTKSLRIEAIADELERYVKTDLKRIWPEEAAAFKAFSNVTGKNFKSEEATFAALRTQVIPHQERFVQLAESLPLKTLAIRNLHKELVLASRLRLMAYRQMLAGQGDKDALWQYGVRAEFEQADKMTESFRNKVAALANEQEVKLQ